MKAERSRSNGCRTIRKVVAERRNLFLAAGSFDLKVKVAKTLRNQPLFQKKKKNQPLSGRNGAQLDGGLVCVGGSEPEGDRTPTFTF